MEAAKYRTIIVDDSKLSLKIIKETIEEMDSIELVGSYNNPLDALEFVENHPVDLAIIDVVMPKMTGIELCKKINLANAGTQVIVISSLNNEQIIIDAISAGASDFVHKPFSKSYLQTCVSKALENYNKF